MVVGMVTSKNCLVLITTSPMDSQYKEEIAEGKGGVSGAVPIHFSGFGGLQ